MSLVGEVFLDLLEQDVLWRTSDGRVLPLEAMDMRHRSAVLKLLGRMAENLYASWVDEFLVEGVTYDELAGIGVSEPDSFTLEYGEEEVIAWFDRQPLVRRLKEMTSDATTPTTWDPPC